MGHHVGVSCVGVFVRSRAGGPALVAAVASAALLWLPAIAGADAKPAFTAGPEIVGTPAVGSILTVAATWTGDPIPTVKYTWGRCPPTGNTCKKIGGAEAAEYTVTTSDVDSSLAAVVELKNKAGTTTTTTAPTAVVMAPPPPPPPPAPSPPRQDPLAPAPAPLVPTAPAPVSAPSKAPPPTLLRPFPVVRIRGYVATAGARITLLSVRGPRSAGITVRCIGKGCPVASLSLPRAPARLHPFERFLRAGTRLEVSVGRPGRIGKYTSFLIRANRRPLRTDRCLMPGRSRPTRCPAS